MPFHKRRKSSRPGERAPLGKRDQGGFRLTLRTGFARDALPACFPHSGRQASVLLRSLLTPYNPLETTRAVALDPGLHEDFEDKINFEIAYFLRLSFFLSFNFQFDNQRNIV